MHAREMEALGESIAETAAMIDAATHRFLTQLRRFDQVGGWHVAGAQSCAHWLSWRVGLDLGAARERVRVARALATLPRIAASLARAEISYAKARAITRVATPATEERLLTVAQTGTPEHVERIVRGWRHVDRVAEARESRQQHTSRSLHVYQSEDGTVVVRGRLAPEVGVLLMRALDAARETLYPITGRHEPPADPAQERPAMEQQLADALALLAETALHHGIDPGTAG